MKDEFRLTRSELPPIMLEHKEKKGKWLDDQKSKQGR